MLRPGDQAPLTLHAIDQTGTNLALGDLLRTGPLIVFFYPADFSPVCTAEVCMFRDVAQELADAGARVVGVSPQSSKFKARFASQFRVTFPLLADTDGSWGKAFGVSMFFGLITRRATFLLDPSGKVIDRVVSDLTLGAHRRLLERVTRGAPTAGPRST